jgi:hypothetical protein
MSMKRLSRDEAFLIAVNVAKLPNVPWQILKDIPRPPNSASRDDWGPPMPEKYIKPAVVAAGALMMLLGVYQLAGWWGLLTALGATLLLFGALN